MEIPNLRQKSAGQPTDVTNETRPDSAPRNLDLLSDVSNLQRDHGPSPPIAPNPANLPSLFLLFTFRSCAFSYVGAMTISTEERISHVSRRLGIGANAALVDEHPDAAAAVAAMLVAPRANDISVTLPDDWDDIEAKHSYPGVVARWIERLVDQRQPLLERMTWFWHDHFATSNTKVGNTFLMWQQHLTIRSHALGNFRDLLHAIAKDPAMLIYLDGDPSTKERFNENFAREVMELHTMGRGRHTENDVKNAARAFTGWSVQFPSEESPPDEPWTALFDPEQHDDGVKTIFGVSGTFGMDEALDLILEQRDTGPFVAASVYRGLVGLEPDPRTAKRLGESFAQDWDIGRLVEAVVSSRAFLSDAAVNSRVRTPLEKVVTLLQGFARNDDYEPDWLAWTLEAQSFAIFNPPNPAGYPSGRRLLSPGQLTSAFGLLNVIAEPEGIGTDEILHQLGLFDVSARTRFVIDKPWSAGTRLALAFGSPEFAVT